MLYDRELAAAARAAGIPTYVIGEEKTLDVSAPWRLVRAIHRNGYSVVHAHGYKATTFCGMARCVKRFALVKTEHGLPETGLGSRRERWLSGLYRAAERLAMRLARGHVVFVTRELQQTRATDYAGLKSRVIYNGIDVTYIQGLVRPPEFVQSKFNVVVVGRLEPVKGVEFAVHAMTHPAVPAHVRFHVLGDGPLRAQLRALTDTLSLGERVHFYGFRHDAVAFIAHADVLLIPSLHEGLPYTLLEAIAAGTPVVASEVGGLREVLKHELTALLVPPGSSSALANSINRLVADAALGESLAASARHLLKEFSAQGMADAYWRAYVEAGRSLDG